MKNEVRSIVLQMWEESDEEIIAEVCNTLGLSIEKATELVGEIILEEIALEDDWFLLPDEK